MKRNWLWRNVPVPEVHLGFLAAGVLLELIVPRRVLPEAWLAHAFGWPLLLSGAALAAWAVKAAGRVDMERPTDILLRGPFALSRNPMYVGWTLIYVGTSFLANAAWPLFFLPAVLLSTHRIVRSEERGLERRFGDEYRRYEASVRRYL